MEQGEVNRPMIQSRRTRRGESLGKPLFLLDEQNVKSFSFRNRYYKNQMHGRNTSTIVKGGRTGGKLSLRKGLNTSQHEQSATNDESINPLS